VHTNIDFFVEEITEANMAKVLTPYGFKQQHYTAIRLAFRAQFCEIQHFNFEVRSTNAKLEIIKGQAQNIGYGQVEVRFLKGTITARVLPVYTIVHMRHEKPLSNHYWDEKRPRGLQSSEVALIKKKLKDELLAAIKRKQEAVSMYLSA